MKIIFINQHELFTTIDKDIQFWGLAPLANITKEDCYMDLDIVTRHYNRSGFSIRHIECDGELKKIMDEVSY